MWLRRRVLILYILSATVLILFLSVLHNLILDDESGNYNFNFDNFNNANASKYVFIPNIVHYVIFNNTSIGFVTYLSIISVIKVQNPKKIIIHSDSKIDGYYWEKLKEIATNTSITVSYLNPPTHVYGQRLSSIYHATDIARIQVLRLFGGIYLDTDVLLFNNLNKLRHFEMVVGLPKGDYMGTQILLANKNARFLRLWLDGYKRYQPRDWYYNAGRVPTKILNDFPYLAHKEEVKFGVQNLLDKLHTEEEWNEWKHFYSLHLLSRHEPAPQNLDEEIVQRLNTNFGRIARWILNK